eukprot:gene40993-33579_t
MPICCGPCKKLLPRALRDGEPAAERQNKLLFFEPLMIVSVITLVLYLQYIPVRGLISAFQGGMLLVVIGAGVVP